MATECEAPFRFDPENMSPNISLCGSGMLYVYTYMYKYVCTVYMYGYCLVISKMFYHIYMYVCEL